MENENGANLYIGDIEGLY